jgi:hypothetical protein
MRAYKIYRKDAEVVAVKDGFSYPGFSLPGFGRLLNGCGPLACFSSC